MIDCWNWIFSFCGEKEDRDNVVLGMGKEEKHLLIDLPPPLLLLTIHGEEYKKQSFYNLVDNRCQTTRLPVLNNKCVLGSAYGWLVLLDNSEGDFRGDCLLWNPATMETIELLHFEDPCPYNRCLLSNSPTDPDCFIVFEEFNCSTQIVCRISDGLILEVDCEDLSFSIIAMVSFRGLIFGIIQPGFEHQCEFVTIHVVGDTLEVRPLLINGKHTWGVPSQPILSWITWNTNYLIESPCGNELLLVNQMLFNVYLKSGVHFRIYRVDVTGMLCEELANLDGRTIFIGFYGNGFCWYSESFGGAIKPNSIYYTDRKGMVIHVYDLDDRSTTTLLPNCSELNIDLNSSTNYWVDLPHNILESLSVLVFSSEICTQTPSCFQVYWCCMDYW